MNNLKKTQDSYNLFLNNIIKDILLFVFLTFVFLVYKIIFLFIFRTELADTSFTEIIEALFLSVKFSLNTVGLLVFISFLFSSAIQQFYRKYPADKIRLIIAGIFFFIISLLFQIKVPYYMEFHVSFSPFIFNTFNDDVNAIFQTIVEQYGFFSRIFMAIFLTGIFIILFKYFLKVSDCFFNFIKKFNLKKTIWVLISLFTIIILFNRLNGKINIFLDSPKKDVKVHKHLLREILSDEIEALYYSFSLYMQSKNIPYTVTLNKVQDALSLISDKEGNPNLTNLSSLFTHISKGLTIKKPKHIFLIVGENYALWPFLDNYKNLPLAKNMRNLLKKHDNIFIKKFLPASSGTMASLSSVITGIPYVNLDENIFILNNYETSLFPQISRQGYKTHFFYGGFPYWANIDFFVNNQRVDESYYSSSFSGEKSVWGIDDKSLFQGVLKTINEVPSFNLILTVSNHSPFPIDMDKEPEITSKTEMGKFIEEEVKDKDLLIKKMQHYEYMDKTIADFIGTVLQKYPDSLFIVTGDHAERWNLGNNPTLQEKVAVPLIIIADGISSNKDDKDLVGSHIDIIPTIMELVSPKGTTYYSIGKDILHEQDLGFNDYSWINRKMINYGFLNQKELFNSDDSISPNEIETAQERVNAYKTISAWYVSHGLKLK